MLCTIPIYQGPDRVGPPKIISTCILFIYTELYNEGNCYSLELVIVWVCHNSINVQWRTNNNRTIFINYIDWIY